MHLQISQLHAEVAACLAISAIFLSARSFLTLVGPAQQRLCSALNERSSAPTLISVSGIGNQQRGTRVKLGQQFSSAREPSHANPVLGLFNGDSGPLRSRS